MKRKITVAITGMNAGESPQPGPAVARSLREAKDYDFTLVGLIYDAMESGVYYNGLLDAAFLIPYPSSGTEEMFERIEAINNKIHIDVLIPTLDAELSAYSKLESRLLQLGIKLFLPTEDQLSSRSKLHLPELTRDLHLQMPNQKCIGSYEELSKMFNEFSPPVVVKGIYYEAGIANDYSECKRIAGKITSKWGWPIILQERIVGGEYDLAMFGDGSGSVIGEIAMKKMALTEKGKAFSGMTINDENIYKIGKNFVSRTKWRGALELEFVKETKSEMYYLIEINPRFPAWIYLSSAAGQNLALAYVEMALGLKSKTFDRPNAGIFFVRHAIDLVSDLNRLEELSVNSECFIERKKYETQ